MAASDTYACTLCGKTRLGRFTRPKLPGGQDTKGWRSRGAPLPSWYCWACLIPGQGRDEEETMPSPRVIHEIAQSVVPVKKGEAELTAAKSQIQRVYPTIQTEVAELVVSTPEQYQYADALLSRIRDHRKGWGQVWSRIQERTIKPIRDGLEALYEMNREVDPPLEQLETVVKAKMKAFKVAELKQIAAAAEAKRREEQHLAAEAEEKRKAAESAKTPQMRGKLSVAAERLAREAAAIAQQEAPTPTTGETTSVRTQLKFRVKDALAFYAAIGDGTLPLECGLVNMPVMNRHFKEDPEGMKAWPGIEVYDDINIVGR